VGLKRALEENKGIRKDWHFSIEFIRKLGRREVFVL
jgi:hypothetical protein